MLHSKNTSRHVRSGLKVGGIAALLMSASTLITPLNLQAQSAGPLNSPLPTPSSTARITIRINIDPSNNVQNFRFNGSFGLFVLDTDYDADPYSSSRTFTVNPGAYKVEEWVPTGWYVSGYSCGLTGPYGFAAPTNAAAAPAPTAIPPANPKVTINVRATDNVTCVFNNVQYGQIEIRKWNDVNADGLRTGNEPFLSGWKFVLFDSNYYNWGTPLMQGVTDANGRVMFKDVRPGQYMLCEELVSPWRNSRPTSTGVNNQPCYQYLYISAGMKNEAWFGNYKPTTSTVNVVPRVNTAIDQQPIPATDN